MKHYGDITKLNGWELPIVDVITGGSPCQDLSVAGKRAGLAGERSGLFMEQIRITKEMREHDRANRGSDVDIRLLRPRYMVWENVPGALSSPGGENRGQDFRCVLEEICRIADKAAVIPEPPKGEWSTSGCIMGSGEFGVYSVAWRVHDAQFWGVPQRRKRIALVADFGGYTAPEILFERKSLFGDIEESREEREETAEPIGEDSEETISFQERESHVNKVYGISAYDSNAMKSSNPSSGIYEADTTRTLDNNGGNPACNQGGMIVLEGNGSRPSHKGDGYRESDTMYTLNTTEYHAVCVGNGQTAQTRITDKVGALNCMHDQQAVITYDAILGGVQ